MHALVILHVIMLCVATTNTNQGAGLKNNRDFPCQYPDKENSAGVHQ